MLRNIVLPVITGSGIFSDQYCRWHFYRRTHVLFFNLKSFMFLFAVVAVTGLANAQEQVDQESASSSWSFSVRGTGSGSSRSSAETGARSSCRSQALNYQSRCSHEGGRF